MNSQQPTKARPSYFPFEAVSSDAQSRMTNLVMQRIAARRVAKARAAATLYGITSLLGILLLIPAISYTAALSAQSGFMNYISLIVSDGMAIASSWRPFILSVLESAPVSGTVLVLAALLVFGYSLTKFLSDISRIKSYRHATL